MEMNAEIKALLISIGSANIDESLLKEAAGLTTPSAGPGAGLKSFFMKSGNHRVRLSVNKNSPIKIVKYRNGVMVIKNKKAIVTGTLEPALSHCPDQAYITISSRCIYNCKFCAVPKLRGDVKSVDKILQLVEEAEQRGKLRAIALTSGVAESADEETKKTVKVVRALRKKYDLPIGVSIYPTKTSSQELHEAGATEIKYNVESMDPEVFKHFCPGMSSSLVLKSLEKSVEIFGDNRVASNFILGLGESDECVIRGLSQLAEMGVISILRPISPHPLRIGEAEVQRPSAERLLKLAKIARKVFDDYGLRTDLAETMCLPCTGCDITPHRDI